MFKNTRNDARSHAHGFLTDWKQYTFETAFGEKMWMYVEIWRNLVYVQQKDIIIWYSMATVSYFLIDHNFLTREMFFLAVSSYCFMPGKC